MFASKFCHGNTLHLTVRSQTRRSSVIASMQSLSGIISVAGIWRLTKDQSKPSGVRFTFASLSPSAQCICGNVDCSPNTRVDY